VLKFHYGRFKHLEAVNLKVSRRRHTYTFTHKCKVVHNLKRGYAINSIPIFTRTEQLYRSLLLVLSSLKKLKITYVFWRVYKIPNISYRTIPVVMLVTARDRQSGSMFMKLPPTTWAFVPYCTTIMSSASKVVSRAKIYSLHMLTWYVTHKGIML
jgi:hypothetical protein